MSLFHTKPNSFVSHVHIKVENLERSLKFYQQLMGFQVLEHRHNKAVLTADGTTPLLTIEQPEAIIPKQRRTTGLYHFALILPTRKDLGKLIIHLVQTKYPLQGASNHGISEALYFADPDGNGIEVAVDTDPSTWRNKNGGIDLTRNGPMDVESVVAEARGENWTGLPMETIMGHIHLHVSDLEKTKEFYRDGLGMDVIIDFPNQAVFFSSGGYHHHIGTNIWNGKNAPKPAKNSVGMLYYTVVLPNDEIRKAILIKLASLGYKVIEDKDGYWTEDPAGNRILLVC